MNENEFKVKQEAALKQRRNLQRGRRGVRKVPIPSSRYNRLRNNWPKITAPIVQQLKLQIRFNPEEPPCGDRCPKDQTPNLTYLAKAENDAIALVRLDHMFLESFEVTDESTLMGAFTNLRLARHTLCLLFCRPLLKAHGNLRDLASRIKESF
ncbi:hypothetical protein M3Y99_02003900 [Aphelenchoides fujianensis]|nr:hypothetical protein M3Y99_02003900 [Aphelenchoides fujianensis]